MPNALSVLAISKQFGRPFPTVVIVGFCISQGTVWTPRGLCWLCWLAALLGLCGESIALIKGGPKHQLKSTGPRSCGGQFEQFSHCIMCVEVCMCWSVMSYWATALLLYTRWERQAARVTLNYCFPNTRESMWNGYDSVRKEPRDSWVWHVIHLMSLLLWQCGYHTT